MNFIKSTRQIVGKIILTLDQLTPPKGIQRSPQDQKKLDEICQNMTLYQFKACPFCVKVRRAMKRLSLSIPLKDAQNNPQHRKELLDGGGKIQTPCLLLANGKWMYESNDIILYLENVAKQ